MGRYENCQIRARYAGLVYHILLSCSLLVLVNICSKCFKHNIQTWVLFLFYCLTKNRLIILITLQSRIDIPLTFYFFKNAYQNILICSPLSQDTTEDMEFTNPPLTAIPHLFTIRLFPTPPIYLPPPSIPDWRVFCHVSNHMHSRLSFPSVKFLLMLTYQIILSTSKQCRLFAEVASSL